MQIWIFSVLNIASLFLLLVANRIFQFTILLLIYFCDHFMALEIRHSRCHCMVFSVEDKILIIVVPDVRNTLYSWQQVRAL